MANVSRGGEKEDARGRINDSEWQTSHKYIMAIYSNIAIREMFYKLRHRWYLTARRLHKITFRKLSAGDARMG